MYNGDDGEMMSPSWKGNTRHNNGHLSLILQFGSSHGRSTHEEQQQREQGCIVFLLDRLDVGAREVEGVQLLSLPPQGLPERKNSWMGLRRGRKEKGFLWKFTYLFYILKKIYLFNLLNPDHLFILALNLMTWTKGPFGMPDSIRPDRIRADSIRPDKNLILCSVWYVTV